MPGKGVSGNLSTKFSIPRTASSWFILRFPETKVTFAINGIEPTADPAATNLFITALYQTNSFAFPQLFAWPHANTASE